jgi:ABC-type transporter Mla subunit MlaD
LESITDTINNLKEDITSFNESLNQKTKELVECTEQMTKNASNKVDLIMF